MVAATVLAPRATAQPGPGGQPSASSAAEATALVWSTGTLTTIGSVAEERARLGQLLRRDSASGFLIRTPQLREPAPGTRRDLVAVAVLPEVLVTRNSRIPSADNDGALWAGRGASLLVRGGLALRAGRLTVRLVPEVAYARNLGFASAPAFLTGQQPPTGPFAAQWFVGPYSADLPIRFGDQSYTLIALGQSRVDVTAGPVVAGLSSENQWWGPGVRNALLMSNAGEGVPHAFVRTRRPVRTGVGDLEARWILGAPTRSLYFQATRDVPEGRSLNGAVVTLRPRAAPDVTVGLGRLVLAPTRGGIVGHAFDVVRRADHLGRGDTLATGLRSDQLTSVFARWMLPGGEIYGEFARLELPRSLRDFLIAPLNTGAYTLGLARAWRGPRAGALRGSLEVSNLEQTRTFTDRPPPPDYYTGRAAPAGFTTRGQPTGAAIGPGSSSQWAAVDYVAAGWQAGLFAERVRHQNDALYRVFIPNAFRHDVSLAGGLRGGVRRHGVDALATLRLTNRLNYLFQNGTYNTLRQGSVDVRNVTLNVSLSPAPRPPR